MIAMWLTGVVTVKLHFLHAFHRFLLQHAKVLAIGTVLVMGVKTGLVAGTVR